MNKLPIHSKGVHSRGGQSPHSCGMHNVSLAAIKGQEQHKHKHNLFRATTAARAP